ncbi:MAG: tetratricopeptide repeat protein [Luteolibacter sp.]
MKSGYSLVSPLLLSLSLQMPLLAGEPAGVLSAPVAAAPVGDADAQYQMARAYLRGDGVPKDVQKSYDLMKAAAAQGHADATGGIGYFYSSGMVVAKDERQAADWFRKGAEMGSAKAQLNLGKYLLNGKAAVANPEAQPADLETEGLKWIGKAADQGLPEAASSYGMILYFGEHGQPQDYTKAAVYLKIAAESGMADAQNALGLMYDQGLGVNADPAAAEDWLRKAALQGQVKAQANLGRVLNPLSEKKETRIEALAWLEMAANQNDVTARKSIADATPGLKEGDLDAARTRALELRKLLMKKP